MLSSVDIWTHISIPSTATHEYKKKTHPKKEILAVILLQIFTYHASVALLCAVPIDFARAILRH